VLSRVITIDDFRKVELRVARIISAEPHPNADRLLVLKVDLGTEQRQLVAGIRASYQDLAALAGREVIVVANLEPAKLRGVESQGMVLATQDALGISLLRPDRDVAPGSAVS
jgi:methionyl-tRNA synthetase